jgi:prepilin-type N-terminal cleavage/methylation domain-containing protein
MNFIKVKNAFTLVELLVWVTIIGIISLWVSSLNFNRLSNKQNLEIFTNSIKTNFETIRNNSLEWKWIWANIDVPNLWKIDYSLNNGGKIISYISNNKWITWINNSSIPLKTGYSIKTIKCWKLGEAESIYSDLTNTWTWSIIFNWINIKLDFNWDITCNWNNHKILKLIIDYKWITKSIKINSINWLIETK